jgi:hypothetical protein
MAQRFSEYVRKERDDYPTPAWVTEAVIPHLKALKVRLIWEPAAGEGGMAAALAGAGLRVISTGLKDGVDFLDERTWPSYIARGIDGVITNPPYGTGGRMAGKFIAPALS